MSQKITRRNILQATAASGIAVSLAGCSGFLGSESACEACENFIVALDDGEYEDAAAYLGNDDVPDFDEDEAVERAEEVASNRLPDGEIEEVSCACAESVFDEDEHEAELEELEEELESDDLSEDEEELFEDAIAFGENIRDQKEVRFELTYEDDDDPHVVYLNAVEVSRDWVVEFTSDWQIEACSEDSGDDE